MLRIITGGLLVAAFCACSSTWTVPPGSEKATVVGAFLGSENRIMADIMRYGFPDTGMIRYREGYVLSYDGRNRAPAWVAERLDPERLVVRTDREGLLFRVDRSLPVAVRAQSNDYAGSGYVRGRLAAASNHLDDRVALEQTYYLSNVVPQDPAFRQNFWVHFEARVREWARAADALYVVTGPLYLPTEADDGKRYVRHEVIGANGVAVPTHFFKVMLSVRGDEKSMQAFLVPHDPALTQEAPLSQFLVTADEVERWSGLDFFPKLSEPSQGRLEASRPDRVWGEEP